MPEKTLESPSRQFVSVPVEDLATVLSCAGDHVEDILSGLIDGTYERSENANIDAKQAALKRVSALLS